MYHFVCLEYKGLRPGLLYRFRVRATNETGNGPWSVESFTTSTVPDTPEAPERPRAIAATLTSITFGWDPPDQRGDAISGYRVQVQHTGRVDDLPRTQITYLLEHLLAGKFYRIRVCAINAMGPSEYSDWNDLAVGCTKTDKPERAR